VENNPINMNDPMGEYGVQASDFTGGKENLGAGIIQFAKLAITPIKAIVKFKNNIQDKISNFANRVTEAIPSSEYPMLPVGQDPMPPTKATDVAHAAAENIPDTLLGIGITVAGAMGAAKGIYNEVKAVKASAAAARTASEGAGAANLAENIEQNVDNVLDIAENASPIIDPARLLQAPNNIARNPYHHVFPQRTDLAERFCKSGIDIDQYAIQLDTDVHIGIHKGAPRGGLWNKSWEEYFITNPNATSIDIYKKAGELIYNHGIDGKPVIPYSKR